MRDVAWLTHLDDALARARRERLPVVVKPLGQGMGPADDW